MGRYIDWQDVTNKYADMATKGGADETRASFLTTAEDEVDTWLAPYYSVPFTPCPGVVRDLSIDIAYYKATVLRKGSDLLWKYIERRLKAIQDGTMQLTVSGSVIERSVALPERIAMVSSVPPVGGMSVEDSCFFERAQN